VEKSIFATFVCFKILPEENNCYTGGNSPNLVTLPGQEFFHQDFFYNERYKCIIASLGIEVSLKAKSMDFFVSVAVPLCQGD
jgi:hypothetical protein